jgi:dihydrodipicolinate synthase/N-acetylneuraminate lyase
VSAPRAAPGAAVRYPRVMLGTVCLPWDERGGLLEDLFREQVRRLGRAGLRERYVFGTAGEGYAVTEAQFDQVTRIFVEEMAAQGAPPMVGVISLSLGTVVARIERAAALGVRRFQVSLPSWGTLTGGEVGAFFDQTCGRFPECQFLHYNLGRAGRLLDGGDYAALAARHENLVGTKYGGGDLRLIADLLGRAPTLRHFLTEPGYPAGCTIGEPGLLVSFSSSNLRRAAAFFAAGVDGDLAALAALQRELIAVRQDLGAAMAAAPPAPHMDGGYDKLFSRLLDPRFPLRLLPPYAGASEAAFARYAAVLRRRHPAWAPEAAGE